jgi:hypothetical protein
MTTAIGTITSRSGVVTTAAYTECAEDIEQSYEEYDVCKECVRWRVATPIG